jgi:uncharacterized protein (TIGR01777 family)
VTNPVIAIAGSSGLIGSALTSTLRASDHRVLRLVRRKPGRREESPGHPDDVFWNPDTGDCDPDDLRGVDAVVNLCGVNVGAKRWSGAFKQSLRDSRIGPTEVLSNAIADADVPVLINASAVGYYGDTRDRIVDETASAGGGFLAGLCEDWEAATATAQQSGARVVLARTGLVLGPSGGALNRLKPLFSLGLGGRLGNGRQYMPWISLEDEVRALLFAIERSDVSGPVNLTGPPSFRCPVSRCAPYWASSPTRACSAASGPSPRRSNALDSSSTTTPSVRRWRTARRPTTASG